MLDNQTLLLILLVLAFFLYNKKNTEQKEKKAEDFTETVESSVNDSVQEDFVLTKNKELGKKTGKIISS